MSTQITDDERAYYTHLAEMMLTTRGVRFTAAEAERRKDLHSIIIIAILSIYLTGWTVSYSLYPGAFSVFDTRVLNVVSIISSISLLVISLFDFAAGRSVYAEKLLQNALEISPLARELERELASPAPHVARMAEIATMYEQLVAKSGVNHTSANYRLWVFERKEGANFFVRAILPIAKFVRRSFFFIYSAIFQLMLSIAVIGATVLIGYRILELP